MLQKHLTKDGLCRSHNLLYLKMANDRIQMPSGMGGLVRYFDEYKSKIKFKPGHIIIFTVVIMVIMIFLYTYGNALLGI